VGEDKEEEGAVGDLNEERVDPVLELMVSCWSSEEL